MNFSGAFCVLHVRKITYITSRSQVIFRIGNKMVGTLRTETPHSWPNYALKTALAANLSLYSRDLGGRTSVKPGIFGQFMVVDSANLFLSLHERREGGVKPSHTTTAQKLTRARVQLLLDAAFFRHAQLEVETDTGKSADDGD